MTRLVIASLLLTLTGCSAVTERSPVRGGIDSGGTQCGTRESDEEVVRVLVRDFSGPALSGAQVTIADGTGYTRTLGAVTAGEPGYATTEFRPGDYTATVVLSPYASQSFAFRVAPEMICGGTVRIGFNLSNDSAAGFVAFEEFFTMDGTSYDLSSVPASSLITSSSWTSFWASLGMMLPRPSDETFANDEFFAYTEKSDGEIEAVRFQSIQNTGTKLRIDVLRTLRRGHCTPEEHAAMRQPVEAYVTAARFGAPAGLPVELRTIQDRSHCD